MLIFEIAMKSISSGMIKYFKNGINLFEFFITLICISQIIITDYNLDFNRSYDNEIKLMRACKALMFYRIIKYNKFAIKIIAIANRTVPSYVTLTFLMFYIILIFAIVGMEFFLGRFSESD